ncbi:hypothetical protein V8F20_000322 [Naviculisporaceae sp. PSN 640]
MAPRREILDSEDEGDDFGSINGGDHDAQDDQVALVDIPNNDHAGDNSEQQSLPPSDKTTRNSTGSTDPAFFQRIYDEQQAAACAPDATTTQLTTPRKGTAAEEVDPWELPVSPPPATRSMGLGSSSRSSGRITRSSEKRRQSEQTSNVHIGQEADPYEFPSTADVSPVRPSKRKKRDHKSSSLRQSNSSEAVRETAGSSWGIGQVPAESNHNGPDSSMPPPTLPAMYITTSALTSSQKQQYQPVNLSSQNEPEHRDLAGTNGVYPINGPYKSSGATTIAYPTPSRFVSSVPTEVLNDVLPQAAPPRDSDDPVPTEPMSSPDELAGSAPTNRAKSQATQKAGPSSQLESPVSTRRTKRHTSHVDYGGSFNEPIVLDNTQPPNDFQENDTSDFICDQDWQPGNDKQQNRTRKGSVEQSVSAITEQPPAKKKRGRKKKEQIIEEPVLEEGVGEGALPFEGSSKIELDVPLVRDDIEEPPTKKRRGRPRKSDTAKVTSTAAQAGIQAEGETHDDYAMEQAEVPASKGKRGRKANNKTAKKSKVADSEDEDEEFEAKQALDEPEESTSLSEMSHNTRQPAIAEDANLPKTGKTSDEGDNSESKENSNNQQQGKKSPETEDTEKRVLASKATPAPASKTNPIMPTPGKVQYRVGLSRKSRIAPLLKSLKK